MSEIHPSQPVSSEAPPAGPPSERAPTLMVRPGAVFEGLITCPNAARIEGRFVGNVFAAGRVEIGVDAEVEGRIEARDIVIAGRFEGELSAQQCISLLATARVQGDLQARQLDAQEGCIVSGRCRTISTT